MKILKCTYESINHTLSEKPYETGGILGSSNDDVIDEFILDITIPTKQKCAYYPNVRFLNNEIEKWSDKKIIFCGIIHTHFFDVCTLSDEDKEYIDAIMQAMPKHIKKLYFPLFLLPSKKLIAYSATLSCGKTIISQEETIIT